MNVISTLGGLAGACALTVINESVKKFDTGAPRLDLLGMNAVAKILKGSGFKPKGPDTLKSVSLAGDLLSNSLYFAMAKTEDKTSTLIRGALLGIGAGIGAVSLAKPLGIDNHFSEAPLRTKAMTVAYYLIGGLVAAAVINLMEDSSKFKLKAK